jgi:flagellar hook-associated protein 2
MAADLLSALNKNGTGLNLRELTNSLVQAETAPKAQAIQKRIDQDGVRLSALAQVRASLSDLGRTMADAAAEPVLTVTTSTGGIMPRVTDRNALQRGGTEVEVLALAQRQVLEFTGFAESGASLEAGTLTIDFGTWDSADPAVFAADTARSPVTLTIAAGTSLQALAEQLTEVTGLTARVLPKGDGTVSLGLVTETGAANAVRLTAAGAGGGTVALSALDTTATNAARQVQGAGDARLLVDGITITRPTNTITDALPGMELSLGSVTRGSLTVDRDEAVARTGLEKLVEGLNATLGLLRTVSQRGVSGAEAGDLAGDRAVEAIQSTLRRLVASPLSGPGEGSVSLADLGVATRRDGTLWLDPPAFSRAFAARAQDFDVLFGDTLRSLDDGLVPGGVPSPALASGDYRFNVDASGNATLGGRALLAVPLADGRTGYTALSGEVQGMTVIAEPGVTQGTIRFGRSFAGALATALDQLMASDGLLSRRETEIDRSTEQSGERLAALEARAAILEKRYLTRFAAMEQTVSQLKGTGTYLSNLMDMWAKGND